MSQTFTLPISAADQFNHGHERRQSRPHQRQSRLAPTFPQLPRIPSGSEVPTEHTVHQHEHAVTDQYLYQSHDGDTHSPSRALSNELHAPLIAKQRSFEARNTPTAMASQHRHVSGLTDVLLHATEKYALLHGIIADEESRRIFYFMWLNLGFMIVQSTYGYLTGSLGLISDSIHMFFDCVALLVGVCAAVMSKWPPSAKFPYGYGKIDTLAGLGNGIFLMLISVEIVYEAFERLFEGATLQRTSELLYVSIAGLAVNMVGIFAFHGHHGHHHGHDHSHGGHSHAHDSHDPHTPSNAASASPTKPQASGGHGHHHHGGENMQGIYLHIMADALGSVAVVISTLLVQFTGWSGFDPLASCIIAVLIFISTIPLVSSTIKILLLSLNSDIEYNLRDVLGGVSSIRGVVGYTAPKFWLEDIKKDDHGHDHHHDHSHSHSHGQPHSHSHEQHNATAHTHNHDHSHDHANSHCSSDHSHSHPPSHSHTHDHDAAPEHAGNDPAILGTIHIQISQYADLRDVQARVTQYFYARKMDVVVQYERDGDNKCWCSASGSAGAMRTPQTGGMRTPISGSFSAGYPSGFMAQQIGGSQMREKGVGSPLQKML